MIVDSITRTDEVIMDFKIGDLVRYRKCGTHGVITRTWEVPMPKLSGKRKVASTELMLEVLWSDGKVSDTLSRRVVAVCK